MNGKQIQHYLNNGANIKVVSTANKSYTSSTIQYRLFTSENTFIKLTKFQALAYLSEEQKQHLAIFESVKQSIKKGNEQFKYKLEFMQQVKKDMQLKTAYDCITQMQYVEL